MTAIGQAPAPPEVSAAGRSREVKGKARRRQPPRWAQPSPATRWASTSMLILAGLAAWLLLFIGPLSALKEGHAQATLYSQFRGELSSPQDPPAPFNRQETNPAPLIAGDPVAVMSIPAIGMSRTVVVEGTRSGDLEAGPGHLPGTVLPGETGQSWLLGRSFGYGGPFGSLSSLVPGNTISVTTGQGSFTYDVVDVRGPGSENVPTSLAAASSRLVLVTAANQGWRDVWVPTHAIYVDAVLAKGETPVAAVGTTTPVAADSPMKADTSGLIVLVLWLQLLFISVIAIVWAMLRWGRRQAWVIGTPVLIAVLWGTSLQFTQLLPNLL